MKYLKYYEELNKELSKEVDIIYKDSNLLCMMPKTQKASRIYGKGTKWCQTSRDGFGMWSASLRTNDINFLIRFIFKNVNGKPRKLRFTYEPTMDSFHWANESGIHYFKDYGISDIFNPKLDIKLKKDEKDIIDLIKFIPNECKEKVINYIESKKNIKPNDIYKYNNIEYLTKKGNDFNTKVEELKVKYNLSYFPIDIEVLNTLKVNIEYSYYNKDFYFTRRQKINLDLNQFEKEIQLYLTNLDQKDVILSKDLRILEDKYKKDIDLVFKIRENKIKMYLTNKNWVFIFDDIKSCEDKIQDIIN